MVCRDLLVFWICVSKLCHCFVCFSHRLFKILHTSKLFHYYVVKDCHAHVHVCLLGLRVANVLTRYLLVDKVYLITDVLDANSHQ